MWLAEPFLPFSSTLFFVSIIGHYGDDRTVTAAIDLRLRLTSGCNWPQAVTSGCDLRWLTSGDWPQAVTSVSDWPQAVSQRFVDSTKLLVLRISSIFEKFALFQFKIRILDELTKYSNELLMRSKNDMFTNDNKLSTKFVLTNLIPYTQFHIMSKYRCHCRCYWPSNSLVHQMNFVRK